MAAVLASCWQICLNMDGMNLEYFLKKKDKKILTQAVSVTLSCIVLDRNS